MDKPLIYDLDPQELSSLLDTWEEPKFRYTQLWQGLYKELWATPEEFSTLPISLRTRFSEHVSFSHLRPVTTLKSTDNQTEKTLFAIPGGFAIETVLMRYKERRTLCISTQAGCAMGCTFCATGQIGFQRNLSSGEIVEQVLYFARQLQANDERVTNIVLMGMGEPFHNYDATMRAIDILGNKEGFNLGARRITISTVGLVPAIRRFTQEKRQVNLAISLHATDDQERQAMIPINNRYPIKELMAACRDYVKETRRRITFEWALIKNVNDSQAQATQLAELLQGFLCHVNIIPLNPTEGFQGTGSTRKSTLAFKKVLESHGIPCTVRLRRGIDIQAGCGQLAAQSLPPETI